MSDTSDPSRDLVRLVGDTRALDAIRARTEERSLREQALAEATFSGVLLDLAEESASVSVRTTAGRIHHGRVVALGRDFVVIGEADGNGTYLPLAAVSTVRRRGDRRPPDTAGDRVTPHRLGIAARLGGLAHEHPRVTVVVAGDTSVLSGELRSVGLDVMTLRLDGDPPVTTYVPLASLAELTVLASG